MSCSGVNEVFGVEVEVLLRVPGRTRLLLLKCTASGFVGT